MAACCTASLHHTCVDGCGCLPTSSTLSRFPPHPLQDYSIELSLTIVTLVDIGVLLVVVAAMQLHTYLADRAAERDATAAAAQVGVVCGGRGGRSVRPRPGCESH